MQTNGVDEVKVSGPPKAMVKPQVLTHVIEGFVIQEGNITVVIFLGLVYVLLRFYSSILQFLILHSGSEPFPVGRSLSDLTSKSNIQDVKTESDEEPPSKFLLS